MNYEIASFTWNIATQDARRSIYTLEQAILSLPQVEQVLEHHFARGMYARQLSIPAGCALTGAIHRYEHISILLKGQMTVTTDKGPVKLSAPHVMVAPAGTKRAGYAHEDSVWLTVERTDAGDIDSAQSELVTNDYDGWLKEQECPLQLR